MKVFIKNSYLFLIFFILLLSKDYLLGFLSFPSFTYIDKYSKSLEKEIENINVIKNNNYKTSFSYAKVLWQNPYKFNEEITILIENKIFVNDYVVNKQGLVGYVSKVYENYATVDLITSKSAIFQVKINECYGLLKFEKSLVVTGINSYCKVNKGDLVYTSSLGFYNEKILVGSIKDIKYDENKIENTLLIEPAANLNELSYLLVLSKEKNYEYSS